MEASSLESSPSGEATGRCFGATLGHGRGHLVRVETCLGRGLSRVILVGMPDLVAREARERLPAAFARHDLSFHRGKVLFNLVPAELPKQGLPLDLALAVSLAIASGQAPPLRQDTLFLAELDLQGRLRPPARGTLLAAMAAHRAACRRIITATEATQEACLLPDLEILGASDLRGALAAAATPPPPACPSGGARPTSPAAPPPSPWTLRLDEVRGQQEAHLAAQLAAIGRLNLWLEGPPGTGKSMLARRLGKLRPPLDAAQAMALAQVEALHGPVPQLPYWPPFRAPHASASAQALLGGGRPLRPGELARAHGGILFLDELPEFNRQCLESLRQPLEEREVRLQRAREWACFPADLMLVATSNPCPCGFLGHPQRPCTCPEAKLRHYRSRLSGPLRDRFDLFVRMDPIPAEALTAAPDAERDESLLARLAAARAFQAEQVAAGRSFLEAADASLEAIEASGMSATATRLLHRANATLHLSGRGILRCLRTARAAADLAQEVLIEESAVRLALRFRPLPTAGRSATGSRHFRSRAASRPEP